MRELAMSRIALVYSVLFLGSLVSACGGGGGAPFASTNHEVTITWTANREQGVNMPGGGYRVTINSQPPVEIPYLSGPATPTSLATTLSTGRYTVVVRAYAALDASGGSSGSISEPSKSLTVIVP